MTGCASSMHFVCMSSFRKSGFSKRFQYKDVESLQVAAIFKESRSRNKNMVEPERKTEFAKVF